MKKTLNALYIEVESILYSSLVFDMSLCFASLIESISGSPKKVTEFDLYSGRTDFSMAKKSKE